MTRTSSPRDSRILDIGCGEGYYTESLLDVGDTVTCVDTNEATLSEFSRRFAARVRTAQVVPLLHNIEELPFPGLLSLASFDVVLCHGTFLLFRQPVPAAENIWSLLREGGHLIISCTSRNSMLFRDFLACPSIDEYCRDRMEEIFSAQGGVVVDEDTSYHISFWRNERLLKKVMLVLGCAHFSLFDYLLRLSAVGPAHSVLVVRKPSVDTRQDAEA